MNKRSTLWVGFVAVLVPLAVLLGLQYRWLRELDCSAEALHKAQLHGSLGAVSQNVEVFYANASRVLDLPASVFTQDQLDRAAKLFKKKGVEGSKHLFVMSFVNGNDEPRFFRPSCVSFAPPPQSPESRAVLMAVAPWKILAYKGGRLERVRLMVEEKDPAFRILLYPITDDSSRLVGVAGMVLDEGYFRRHVLPMAVRNAVSVHFPGKEHEPIISVEDSRGQVVFATDQLQDGSGRRRPVEASMPFSSVFTDWTISVASRDAMPALMTRRNLMVNLGLSAALATVLLGGLLLAFRTASREMKLSRMKNEFVSNVSHELRTPLASIRVFAEFLRLGRFGGLEKVREYGDYIETESRRLTQLINNILDFASIESGRKTYRFERSDVREVVSETLKTFGVRLRQDGFTIHLDGAETPLPPVRLDPGAIAQSISNLLDNAVKYSRDNDPGGKDIHVALRRDGDFVVIAVEDHGVGIPRDEQRKIFDRFHRVSTGLVHDVKGSGLGLAIVRHIVEAHRGRVSVESRPGEGSTFSIHLPVEPPEPYALPAPAANRERTSEA
ncbi:MAG: sensor histidine kinase [Thermoanaerobaculia bacterium]